MRFPKWIYLTGGMLLLTIAILFSGQSATVRGAPAPQAAPDPDTIAAFAKAGCAGCHTIPGVPNAVGLVGPNLTKIGVDAANRKSGMDAEGYIRESILNPAAFIAPQCPNGTCPEGVMPPNMGDRLEASDIDFIVAYLLTLTGADVASSSAYVLVPIPIVRPQEASTVPFAEPPKTFDNDAEVLLGKYLFFDPRLSADASISCASCHQPDKAWTDGKALSDGYPGTLYFRNTPTLYNLTYAPYAYWDGRLEGANDMGTVVRDHITEAHFFQADGRLVVERLKQTPEYVQLFNDAYEKGPSFGRMLNAVSAYVLSLNSGASPYDRFTTGNASALSPEAQAGLELFNGKANCVACHSGATFSDYNFYNLGVPENPEIFNDPLRHITFRRFFRTLGLPNYRNTFTDVGLLAVTQDEADRGAFRTAPLRENSLTAPYMHNGMFATLEDVVRFYNAGTASTPPLGLSDAEILQIVAFLESLTGEQPTVEPLEIPGYQLRNLGDNQ